LTTYTDLSSYIYLESPQAMVNIGWLGRESVFNRGKPSPNLLPALLRLACDPQNKTRGYFQCELCDADAPVVVPTPLARLGRLLLGSAEIHVEAGNGLVYAAPDLIIHYIDAHGYLPPQAFCDAVINSAQTKSS
jgi:hypothetical protein